MSLPLVSPLPQERVSGSRKPRVYYPGIHAAPETAVVKGLSHPFSISATLDVPPGGAQGVIMCHGSGVGGCALFIHDRRAYYSHNYVGALEVRVMSTVDVPDGPVRVRFAFELGESLVGNTSRPIGHGRLFFDDRLVGEHSLPVTIPLALGGGAALSVGRNPGSPVSAVYQSPFPFTGRIVSVTFDLKPPRRG